MFKWHYKNPYFDPSKPHHRKRGFENLSPTPMLKGSDLWRWYFNNRKKGLPKPPQKGYSAFQQEWVITPDFVHSPEEIQKANLDKTGENPQDKIWWLFHSSILYRLGEEYYLTDPVFSQRCSPFQFLGPKRKTTPHFSLEDLPPIRAILISHNHYDHLDKKSIQWFIQHRPETQFILPLGLKRWFKKLGARKIIELDWWEEYTPAKELKITSLPAHHWSKRTLWDSKRSLWCGFMLSYKGKNHYFAGDTAYFQEIVQIPQRFPQIETAFLPIGAYLPRQFMRDQHTSPKEGLQIFQKINARQMVPIHWGTFELANDGLEGAMLNLQEWLALPDNAPGLCSLLHKGLETSRPEDKSSQILKSLKSRVKILKMGEALTL